MRHKKANVSNAQLVVFTGAVNKNNVELLQAKKLGIKTMERSHFLGLIAEDYKQVIAVSGSHGKTTTVGMLASIFIEANLKPTVHIGGESKTTNGNLLIGNKDFFITEACEYKNSFLKINHNVGVILNIENDHTDYFKNLNEIYYSFNKFFNTSKNINVMQKKYEKCLDTKNNKQITYSLNKEANYQAKYIKLDKNFKISFTVFYNNKKIGIFKINSPLKHNVYNALACIAVSRYYNIPITAIKKGLNKFAGIKRRFKIIKKLNSSVIIHDYAHHPTEIASTISSCKEIYKRPITVIFQPHTYTRTKYLMKDFMKSFSNCDKVIVTKTYAAREKKLKGGTGKNLVTKLIQSNINATYIKSFKNIKKYIVKHTYNKQIVLILGAGNIESLAYDYFNN